VAVLKTVLTVVFIIICIALTVIILLDSISYTRTNYNHLFRICIEILLKSITILRSESDDYILPSARHGTVLRS